MEKDTTELGNMLQQMLDQFSGLENKLANLNLEQEKQRTINEHLMNQLLKSKEKE